MNSGGLQHLPPGTHIARINLTRSACLSRNPDLPIYLLFAMGESGWWNDTPAIRQIQNSRGLDHLQRLSLVQLQAVKKTSATTHDIDFGPN